MCGPATSRSTIGGTGRVPEYELILDLIISIHSWRFFQEKILHFLPVTLANPPTDNTWVNSPRLAPQADVTGDMTDYTSTAATEYRFIILNFFSGPSTMPSSSHSTTEKDAEKVYDPRRYDPNAEDPDAEFGGTEARIALEKKLVWKVDLRMSIMVVIYILNYVRVLRSCHHISSLKNCRLS